MTGQLVKAMLTTTDSGATSITFQFNPTELNLKRSIKLNRAEGTRTASGMPKISFARPEPATVTLSNLVFDTYEAGTSVYTKLDPILKAVDFVSESVQRPPIYVLAWGSKSYLKCFVTDIDYSLTMFLEDGTPVRAKVTLTLQEVDDDQA
ncbi:hypothetical protein V2H45_10900 [Tumidithrix elongata RA019]|uniref:Contractile injection system tube protein N-terminal domain-containing protein n=1 Tax=Tumidithrix elongata BACA0141 TaxID=2716417 RepID=A0AAW9Q2X7_9CYAN|nr:hypothetical protein [Tumidithrix elongata RA019]